ncbi:MAG: tRNA epoxyqueuosine(34) reductase QueG [Hyphomicrobiaceae bacterium]
MPSDLKSLLQTEAAASGFDIVRVTTPDRLGPAGERLRTFLAEGRHGDMDWLEDHADRRADPKTLWPDVRSVIMLGINYAPAENPIATNVAANRAVISAYARGRDYHDLVKKGLKRIARTLAEKSGADVKVFVDTAPLMEKPLAQAAGIGWQGKHTNLVSRHAGGSWLFLGAILTTADIPPDAPEIDHCGSCTRCLDACPTNAFPAPYQLDARRCIAYLTIEYKGHIAPEFRAPIGNRVFGCDDCLAVCPWNKFAATSRELKFASTTTTDNPPLADILTLDDATFRTRFAGTPIKRTGRDRVVRNALIAAGNANDTTLLPKIEALLTDPAPIVRAMAVWAIRRLVSADKSASLRDQHERTETDRHVRTEWTRPL